MSRLTITDGDGLYANVVLTFDQHTERSVVEALLRSPKWYVVKQDMLIRLTHTNAETY